ncbi:S-layer homology domain-containing protein [Caldifermentibacillus hisashii]|uniref:S-layer homology domain-containing protein n=1 Tax=Caldifermentibacillus hisashii TaxID=996558 RepID=UPI003100DF51
MAKQKTSRKAFATTAAAVMAATAVTPVAAFAASKTSFPDVPAGEYADAINNLAGQGILNGFDDGTFKPNDPVLREQAAKILATALKLDTTGTENYPDVSPDNWSYKYIVAVTKAGIFGGDENGKFNPFDNLTRQEAAKIIVKAFDFTGSSELTFGDKANIQSWAVPYVKTAVANGILKGDDQGNFNPNANIKRGDFALMIQRALNAVENAKTPKVESVSAINGKQLIVKFNKEVDENFLGTYTLSDGKTVSSTELQEDGKSVKLTLNTAYDNTKAHNVAVTIQNAKVKGTVDTFFPVFTQVISVEDKVKAEIASVEAVTKGDSLTSFKVKFTEPVQPGATFKVNGESVSNAILGAGNQEATITVSSPIKVGVTHKLEVINLTDTAGNVNAVATKEFTISQDSTAPYVNSVEAYGDNKLLVTFSKKMKSEAADLTNMQNNIDVRNDTLNQVTVDRVIPLVGDKTGTKFVVELNRTSAATLFSSTKTSHNLTVLFKNDAIEDSLGNKLAGVTKTVTLVKDTVAPEITSVTFKKNSEGKVTSLVVKFSEGVKANGSLQFPTTLVNDKGVLVNTNSVFGTVNLANVAEGAKEAEFTLATPATVSGKYSISFAKGFVQDTSLAYNDSKVYNTLLDFGTAQTSGEYTIPEANVSSSINQATNTTTIKVVFPEAVKGGLVEGSATDVSRYTLNGRALPVGTTITLNPADSPVPGTAAQTIATIVLPEQSIEKYDNAAVFTINGVVSLSGKVNKPFTKAIEVEDNVSPVIQSAKVLDNKTIELTYSENIAALSNANVGTEFKIYQGTTALTLADSELKANSVSGFPTKIRLTVAQGVDAPATPATKATATVDFGTAADDTDALTLTAKTAGTGGNGIVVKFVNDVVNATTNVTYDAGTKTLTVELADDGTTTPGNVNATTADVVSAINGATDTPVDAAVVRTGSALAAVVGNATTANGADEIPATSATTLDLTKDLFVETLVPSSGVDVLDARGNKQKADVKISVSK